MDMKVGKTKQNLYYQSLACHRGGGGGLEGEGDCDCDCDCVGKALNIM